MTKIEIVCEGCWEIGEGYGYDANFVAKIGNKSISFGYVNEYQIPDTGIFDKTDVLRWAIIPTFVKDWINKNINK
jgi:hypothetical protein